MAFDDFWNISIYEIFHSESSSTIFRHTVKSNKINLLKCFPVIPEEYKIIAAQDKMRETPRCCFYYKSTLYVSTNLRIVSWEIDENLKMNFRSVHLHKDDEFLPGSPFLSAIFVDENGILLSWHSTQVAGEETGEKTCFIRELSFKGDIKDCKKIAVRWNEYHMGAPYGGLIRQICSSGDLVILLTFNGVLKLWDLKTETCIRTLSKDPSFGSKIHLTEKMLIWSIRKRLIFFDLDKLRSDREDFELRSVECPDTSNIMNFTYDHQRILVCSQNKLKIIRNQEQ